MRLPEAILVLIAFASSSHQHDIVKRESKAEKRIVCYYTNWSVYRPGTAKFNPQNINPYLCTHLIYAFGGLDRENGLRPYDKYQDIEQGGYAKFTGLKTYNKALKTMLAIGGWNEGSARFSPLVADEERRKEFVKNVVKFLRINHFDGLDLDWEYPAFRDGGKPRDKDNYAQLVQELREEFERESSKTGRSRLLLTMAVPAGLEYIDKGYDIPKLNKYLDFMNILSYDYHSAFEPSINHHSPLYSLEEESEYNFDSQLTIDTTVKHYLMKGADANKLVLGIPTYGRSYTLFNSESTDIGSPADGPGEQGDATREKGYLAYYEICANVKNGWTTTQPKETAMGPYAYKGNQWVGYDDEAIVRRKSQYVNEKNLGGIMFWSIDNDDFRGKCHSRPYPLIEAAKEALIRKAVSGNKLPTSPRGGKTSSKIGKAKAARTTTVAPTQTPATITTPDPPTTPDPGSDFVCKDEGFFPHPRDCKKYFWCLDSGPSNLGIVAHQFTCPSGLFFNKAADSCDFARNVICNKKSTTTTTTTSVPKTTKASSSNNKLFTTVKTTTTTTTTTTEPPPEEEEEYFDEHDEEDPQTIKQLISLIKKLGGVAELEKQLEGNSGTDSTTPAISKSLYDRVISKGPPKYQTFQRNGPSGPQNEGLPRESGRSSTYRKEKPQYVTIRRERPSTSTTESIDSLEYEEEIEEERPKYKNTYRNRGSQNEGIETERSTERSRPKYQPIERFRTRQQENRRTPEETSSSDRSTTLRYTNIFRSRSSPSSDVSATTPRYVTLQRHRTQTQGGEHGTTENELPDEEEITEELIVETTTTARPRIKVSDVLTTTPAVRTSTRVVTQVVEGATQRQRVPLHKLKQILKDSDNFIETVTKPYSRPTEEPKSERPILSSFNRKRPEIIVTSTSRTTPAYLSQRRNKFRSTTTEANEVTKKSRGFSPSRTRFRQSNEENENDRSKEEIPQRNRFALRQKYNRNNANDNNEEENRQFVNRFSPRQRSTTESSHSTTDHYNRSRTRYVTIRRTTAKSVPISENKDEDSLFSREFSRETNVVRRPVVRHFTENQTPKNESGEMNIKDNITEITNSNYLKQAELNVSSTTEVNSSPLTSIEKDLLLQPDNLKTTTETLTSDIGIQKTENSTDPIPVSSTVSNSENNFKINETTKKPIVQIMPTILSTSVPLKNITLPNNSTQGKPLKSELNVSHNDQETSSNDILLETKNVEAKSLPNVNKRNRTKIILRKRKPLHQNENSSLISNEVTPLPLQRQNPIPLTNVQNITHQNPLQHLVRIHHPLINKTREKNRIIIRKRKPEPSGKSINFSGDSEVEQTSITVSTTHSPNRQRTSRGKTKYVNSNQNTNSLERVRDQNFSTNSRRTPTRDNLRIPNTNNNNKQIKHKRIIIRGRKKFTEDEAKKLLNEELGTKKDERVTEINKFSNQKRNIYNGTVQSTFYKNSNIKDGKGKVRRVVLKKTIKDLAVGESGVPDSREEIYEITNNSNPRGAMKIWDSLAKEDVDNFFNEDDYPSSDKQEITRTRRPFNRRPISRSSLTTTTTTTEAPTTPRQRTTIQSLRQRLNKFKAERNVKQSTSTSLQEDLSPARPRKGEFRRVVKPSLTRTSDYDSQSDIIHDEVLTKDTLSKPTQYHRETSFKPKAFSLVNREDKVLHSTQIEEQATESSFTDEHITDEHGFIHFHENNESDEEPGIPDLANVAVAAIQSLATSPPTKATEQYVFTTPRPSTKRVVTTQRIRTRPTRPLITRPVSTTPVILPSTRSSPRPFSKTTHSSRTLPSPSPPIYDDYDDYYAEPVDIPLSGKVRIHNDGYIECLDIGNFPHPFSCRKFISCAKMENGHLLGWEYTCPKGLSFDPIGGICNWNAGLGCKE